MKALMTLRSFDTSVKDFEIHSDFFEPESISNSAFFQSSRVTKSNEKISEALELLDIASSKELDKLIHCGINIRDVRNFNVAFKSCIDYQRLSQLRNIIGTHLCVELSPGRELLQPAFEVLFNFMFEKDLDFDEAYRLFRDLHIGIADAKSDLAKFYHRVYYYDDDARLFPWLNQQSGIRDVLGHEMESPRRAKVELCRMFRDITEELAMKSASEFEHIARNLLVKRVLPRLRPTSGSFSKMIRRLFKELEVATDPKRLEKLSEKCKAPIDQDTFWRAAATMIIDTCIQHHVDLDPAFSIPETDDEALRMSTLHNNIMDLRGFRSTNAYVEQELEVAGPIKYVIEAYVLRRLATEKAARHVDAETIIQSNESPHPADIVFLCELVSEGVRPEGALDLTKLQKVADQHYLNLNPPTLACVVGRTSRLLDLSRQDRMNPELAKMHHKLNTREFFRILQDFGYRDFSVRDFMQFPAVQKLLSTFGPSPYNNPENFMNAVYMILYKGLSRTTHLALFSLLTQFQQHHINALGAWIRFNQTAHNFQADFETFWEMMKQVAIFKAQDTPESRKYITDMLTVALEPVYNRQEELQHSHGIGIIDAEVRERMGVLWLDDVFATVCPLIFEKGMSYKEARGVFNRHWRCDLGLEVFTEYMEHLVWLKCKDVERSGLVHDDVHELEGEEGLGEDGNCDGIRGFSGFNLHPDVLLSIDVLDRRLRVREELEMVEED